MTSSLAARASARFTAYIKLNYDPNQAMTDVMAKVQQVKYLMPKEANDPVITKTTGADHRRHVYRLLQPAAVAARRSPITSRAWCSRCCRRSTASPQAEILGGQTFAMRVWLDPAGWPRAASPPTTSAAAIRANNFQSAPGQTKGYFTITNVTADTGLTRRRRSSATWW